MIKKSNKLQLRKLFFLLFPPTEKYSAASFLIYFFFHPPRFFRQPNGKDSFGSEKLSSTVRFQMQETCNFLSWLSFLSQFLLVELALQSWIQLDRKLLLKFKVWAFYKTCRVGRKGALHLYLFLPSLPLISHLLRPTSATLVHVSNKR